MEMRSKMWKAKIVISLVSQEGSAPQESQIEIQEEIPTLFICNCH